MKKTGLIAAAAALLILLCSCASSDRMLRLSPFGDTPAVPDVNLDRSLVNLWPVFYRDDRFVSVLWPVIDSDAHGFAVRPFYNKEGAEQSVLFPLSAWNTATGRGYVLNTLWGPERLWIIPFYLNGGGFTSILFPLSGFGSTGGWILNAAWDKDLLAVFPLFARWDDFRHVLNVYWARSEPEGVDYYGVFPLFHHDPGFRQWLLPLYFHQATDRGRTLLTPLFGYGTTGGRLTMFNLLMPVYYFNEEPGRKVRAICWPLVYHEFRDDRECGHILPFYSYDSSWPAIVNWTRNEPISGGRRNNFNILGPFCYQHTARTYTLPFPLPPAGRIPSGERKTNISKTDEEDFILLGLFSWGSEHYLTWRPEYEKVLSELAPILLRNPSAPRDKASPQEEKTAALLRRLPLIPPDAANDEIIKILMRDYTAATESRYRQLIPFYRYRAYQENYHWSSLFGLLAGGYRDHERNTGGIHVHPFFSSETAPGKSEFSLFWPMFQYRAQADDYRWRLFYFLAGGQKQGADSDLQILGFLYRHTLKRDSEQYSVFPFISYRENHAKKQFSFLWRVFNYEKTGNGVSGHIFFIPW